MKNMATCRISIKNNLKNTSELTFLFTNNSLEFQLEREYFTSGINPEKEKISKNNKFLVSHIHNKRVSFLMNSDVQRQKRQPKAVVKYRCHDDPASIVLLYRYRIFSYSIF